MAARKPAEVFPPGDFIREELEERGWTQVDLAEILGRAPASVNEVIMGKRSVSPEIAKGLGDAFETGPEYWLNLDGMYQLSKVRDDGDAVARRAKLYSKAPIKEMIRRHWLEASDNLGVLEKRVLDFFGMGSLDDEPKMIAHAARKSTPYTKVTPAQRAWLFRARQLANSVSAPEFSETRLGIALEQLRGLLRASTQVRDIPRILSEAGIRLVIVEPLPQTRIDGSCMWLDEQSPVVALSLRFDRIDYFWYTLMHEIGHVKNGHGQNDVILDVDYLMPEEETSDGKPHDEREADNFAANYLVPQSKLKAFIKRVRPLYSKAEIVDFARTIGVHAGIVVGQLQHRHEISYAHSRDLLDLNKLRRVITAAALTDGWSYAWPAGR